MNLVERRVATEKLPWQDSDVLGTLVTVDGSPTSGTVNGRAGDTRRHQQLSRTDVSSRLRPRFCRGCSTIRHRHHRFAARERHIPRSRRARTRPRRVLRRARGGALHHRISGERRNDLRAGRSRLGSVARRSEPREHLRRRNVVRSNDLSFQTQRCRRPRQTVASSRRQGIERAGHRRRHLQHARRHRTARRDL